MKMEWFKKWIGMKEQKKESDDRHWYLVRRVAELEKRVVHLEMEKGGLKKKLEIAQDLIDLTYKNR